MCHPASSTLHLCDGSNVRIDTARVGDSVITPTGCEPITGFFHADADAVGTYYKLTTTSGVTIGISQNHWLFVNDVLADPATVHVGDHLKTLNSARDAVVRVETTEERGAYHILVPSGAYCVDSVAASTFIAHGRTRQRRSCWRSSNLRHFVACVIIGVATPNCKTALERPYWWDVGSVPRRACVERAIGP